MDRDALLALSKDDLIALILAQAAQISALTARVADLEAKLAAPAKTPDNSSLPPSRGQKANCPDRLKAPRRGRPGVTRALAADPDRMVEATLAACPHCAHPLAAADQPDVHAYDHIDLPPIRPMVTRIHRHRGVCPCCRKRVVAPAPQGFAPGSPFGPGLCALIIHLHVTQAIGFERLTRLLAEVFGLTLSEGAIGQHPRPRRGAAAGRHGPHRRGGARQFRGRLRRNLGAGGGQDLVAVGPARLDRHLPHHR